MGYTCGRRLTFDVISNIAKNFRTRSEFQRRDPSAYATARRMGILDVVTAHMKVISFSIPQLICQQILDKVLRSPSKYNSRKIIAPYEVDIYYPELKLAVEYNGKGWHEQPDAIERDNRKAQMMKQSDIYRLVLIEQSRDYENDIKDQLCQNVDFLTQFNVAADSIRSTEIDWYRINLRTSLVGKIDELKLKVGACSSLKEFRTIFPSDYGYIIKHSLHHILRSLPRAKDSFTDEQLINIANRFSSYREFSESKYYSICKRRGLMSQVKLPKANSDWKKYTNAELLTEICNLGVTHMGDLKKAFPELYYVAKRRKLTLSKERKVKNDPFKVREEILEMLNRGLSISDIKKQNGKLYSSYVFNKRKGKYLSLEPISLKGKNTNGEKIPTEKHPQIE